MGKIVEMPTKLANMIAAGEVVERPANIVKEVVENSIDANATTIKVYLKDGGLTEVKVIDDGQGMDESDIKLCFLPHATSKIKNEYDLFRIQTLGFRGEALASIASVSEVSLVSKTKDTEAYNIVYKFGHQISFSQTAANIGTTITVKNLFFNTPARLKYLKTKEQELATISTIIDKLALSHPQISFNLFNDDKPIYRSNGKGDIKALIGGIYGLEAARRLQKVEFNEAGFKGTIYYVLPEIYRSNKNQLTYIINGRYVRYYALNDVVVDSFKGYLPINKYPILVLYLTIDPLLIDVNIHPKKEEVKIAEPRQLFGIIATKIKESLKATRHIPNAFIAPTKSQEIDDKKYVVNVASSLTNQEEKNVVSPEPQTLIAEEEPKQYGLLPEQKLPNLVFVGIVMRTYIVCEANDEMYLLDQHACAERIRYEYYAKALGNPKLVTQPLLIPSSLELTKDEALYLKTNLAIFTNLGFKLELDITTLKIFEIPVWAAKDYLDIIRDMIRLIMDNKEINIIDFRDRVCKQISCKASIRANDYITKEEALVLIKELAQCENPYHCPHGRPTIITISKRDLEKMFARVL